MKTKNINTDIDEQEEGISYEKGREFEEQFAQFMKDELGWNKVRVGAHMTGKNNAKGTSIDILGERLDALGRKYKGISTKWIFGSVLLVICSGIWHFGNMGANGFWFFILGLLSSMGAIIFHILSITNNKQNAWVECKNLKGKANINHISKMIREYNDFKASKNEDHRFTHLYFSSANGYVENALKMAMDNGIICYTKKGNSFQEVKYWDTNS